MIRKIFLIILCLSISGCGGFNVAAGIKFKKEVNAKSFAGNPGFTGDSVILNIDTGITFERPIGKCGAGITFFGILLPVIPVWFDLNSCERSFDIDVIGIQRFGEDANLKLRYNGIIYSSVAVEKLIEPYKTKYEYGKKFKFKIDNFWQFRMADDKAIIVSGKTKDGKEFTKELPVKWGVVTYYHWSFP
jgi:hypothetical protein